MPKSRTRNSLINVSVGLLGQAGSVLTTFITRTIFIRVLGAGYLGINGLFTNLLSILAFSELGIGTAITYAMYGPIAESDEKKICAYMNLFAKVYRIVGCVIILGGIIILPFLSFFIKDVNELPSAMPPLELIFLLYVLNSGMSYFFNYKRTLLVASQNSYIDSLNQLFFALVRNLLQVAVLLGTKSFILYLVIQLCCTIAENVAVSHKTNKMFPYLGTGKDEKLSRDELCQVKKNVIAMIGQKVGSVVVSETDNILISKFIGIIISGVYSNYYLLTTIVKRLYNNLFWPIKSSIGNLIAEYEKKSDKEKIYDNFCFVFFINAYIAIFMTTCLMTLSNPFIKLVWGREYCFESTSVWLIMMSFFLNCIRQTNEMYIDTAGLFWQIRWKPIIEAAVNLVTSIYFISVLDLGIKGVVLGTIVSNISTNFWWEPYVVYKHVFNRSVTDYFRKYMVYLSAFVLCFAVNHYLCGFFQDGMINFGLKCLISAVVPNLIFIALFFRTKEFKKVLSLLHSLDKIMLNRRKK